MVKPEIAFGKVLRRFRKRAHLSQEKLASESSLDRTYISLLERGLRQPSLTTILNLAESLQISSSDLITSVSEMLKQEENNH